MTQFSSLSFIKKNVLFWLCWRSWSRLSPPRLSVSRGHDTGPLRRRRSSSCRRWPPSPPSGRSCWRSTFPVRGVPVCYSCWTGVLGQVRKHKKNKTKQNLYCIWKVKGQGNCSVLSECIWAKQSHLYTHFLSLPWFATQQTFKQLLSLTLYHTLQLLLSLKGYFFMQLIV